MTMLNADAILEDMDNIIHLETQEHEYCVDVTVSEIHTVTEAGYLDFGGSEFKEATTEIIQPEKKDPDKEYGWWHLEEGIYMAKCNESLQPSEKQVALIAPHRHARKAGLLMDLSILSVNKKKDPITLIFRVPGPGCNIKENARLGSVYMFRKITTEDLSKPAGKTDTV